MVGDPGVCRRGEPWGSWQGTPVLRRLEGHSPGSYGASESWEAVTLAGVGVGREMSTQEGPPSPQHAHNYRWCASRVPRRLWLSVELPFSVSSTPQKTWLLPGTEGTHQKGLPARLWLCCPLLLCVFVGISCRHGSLGRPVTRVVCCLEHRKCYSPSGEPNCSELREEFFPHQHSWL